MYSVTPPSDPSLFFFFFNDTATTEIYTLSLHDALPISSRFASSTASRPPSSHRWPRPSWPTSFSVIVARSSVGSRSEEHTSELQSLAYLVCRLLLEKKKKRLRQMVLPALHAFVAELPWL